MDRQAYAQFAKLEDRHWWFVGRRKLYVPLLADVLRRGLGREPDDLAVLDVGCGVGGFLGPLERFGRVLGVELDEPAIAWCHARGLRRSLVAHCCALPVPPASQDLLTLWDVLEHTPDDEPVLAEARACLRPGGHLALSLPAYQMLYANNDRLAHHYRRYTRRGIVAKLRRAGFEILKATYVNVTLSPFIIPAVLAVRLKERLVPVEGNDKTNLSWPTPSLLNALLAGIFGSERHWLRHVSAPFGHSIFVVARRRREDGHGGADGPGARP